ncbi:MAG: hypothetical protein FD183_1334 [Chitinophagaceae bacterium]|nr:MAG: hypothetical protein FD183_1334 [Chitinophagaceae bacterium]
MSAETIWATLYNSTSISIAVSTLVGGFCLLGCFVLRLLRLSVGGSGSITTTVGIATVSLLGWYAYRLGVPLNVFVVCVFFASLALCFLALAKIVKNNLATGWNSIYLLPLFALVFTLQALVAFNVTTYPIGTMGNNDIYDWSILAEHLLGSPGYDNVFTTLGGSAQQNRIDSFGTFFILAICAKFMGVSPLEASTVFIILCLSLIGLAIFDLVKNSFGISNAVAFGIAILVPAGSFFTYIAYQHFYGQLLATFFFLTIISAVMQSAKINENGLVNFSKRVTLSIFSLMGILISYQSGFVVFSVISIVFCVCYAVVKHLQTDRVASIVKSARLIILPLLCSNLLAIILLPELAIHTLHRTIEVESVLNGWPLPLVFPAYLFSIPINPGFPAITGSSFQYVIFLSMVVIVFVFAFRQTKKQNAEISSNFLVFAMFIGMSLTMYLLAYYLKGGTYQVWKFSAFVVLPFSFIFYVGCYFAWHHSDNLNKSIKYLLMVLVVIGCALAVVAFPSKLELTSISNKLHKMREAKSILLSHGVENVVLNKMLYGETMMAFNVLSGDFKLYPIVKTYVEPINANVIQRLDTHKTRVLISSKCTLDASSQDVIEGYKILRFDEEIVPKYFFGTLHNHCSDLAVSQHFGFSGSEPWGVWTEGNKVRIQIDIPPEMVGSKLNLMFKVQPFGLQTGSVSVGGRTSSWEVQQPQQPHQPSKLIFTVPSDSTSQGKILLDLHIDRPTSPNSVDSASSDTRLLGIGFISLTITADR